MSDKAYRRYAWINQPHARTILERIGRSLEALNAFGESGNGGASQLRARYALLEAELRPHDEDPALEQAIQAADAAAILGRDLVSAIIEKGCRSDRLGQSVRNLFECLGLAEEGARLSLECGERPDSPLR
jgi:hypothetical protein